MFGKMMHQSLLISNLIEHAAKYHADTSIFSREVTGQMTTHQLVTGPTKQQTFSQCFHVI